MSSEKVQCSGMLMVTIICMVAKFLHLEKEVKALHLEVKRCMQEIEKLNKEFVDMKKEIKEVIKELNSTYSFLTNIHVTSKQLSVTK